MRASCVLAGFFVMAALRSVRCRPTARSSRDLDQQLPGADGSSIRSGPTSSVGTTWSRLVHGSRVSLGIAVSSVVIVGGLIGAVARS